MSKLFRFLALAVLEHAVSASRHDGTLYALRTFLGRRHVQTVTADTCWPFDVGKKLLEELSSDDISTSFAGGPSAARQTHDTWYRHAFVVDLSCDRYSTDTFQRISNDRLFNTQNDWILLAAHSITDETNSSLSALRTFQKYLDRAYVLPDSGVFLFQEIGDDCWEIWNGFRASKSDTMRVFKIATTSPNDFVMLSAFDDDKSDFLGITLKSTTVIVDGDNFFGFKKRIATDIDVFSHMHYEMIVTLSRQLNFKIELSFDNDYGWSLGNGSFSGLTGLLQRETIDFGAAGIFIRTDRMSVIDYTIGTVALRTIALFRQPSLSSVHNIQLLPFTFNVWLAILIIIFIFILILYFLTSVNNCYFENKKTTSNSQEICTLVHGAICQQGLSLSSNLASIRVVIFVLFFTSLFVYTSYSASIVALIQSNSNSIKTIQDIVESPMTFSAQISPYGKHYFEETENTELKTLYRTRMLPTRNQGFIKATDGMEDIRTKFHGFMVEVMSAYKIIGDKWREEEKCGLGEISLFKLPLLSIALVKKSGHKDIFKQKLIQQMEVGINKRIISQWEAPRPLCESSSRAKQYVSVSIKEIQLTLKVFGCGVCISLVIFTLEVVHHAWMNRQSENKS